MAKKKPKEETPKRSVPKYPMDYLFSVADKLHKTVPTRAIILNTLKEIWADGADYGYQRRIADRRVFIDRREKRIKNSKDMAFTNIDNLIHNKKTA